MNIAVKFAVYSVCKVKRGKVHISLKEIRAGASKSNSACNNKDNIKFLILIILIYRILFLPSTKERLLYCKPGRQMYLALPCRTLLFNGK